ncbi:hypothetical protein B0H14DRAFT_3125559 [Mycena olivaceomarginata]|nr:hypothetical protein B0H14DRAFT_3125559 [Mycena olivaceomarginata]
MESKNRIGTVMGRAKRDGHHHVWKAYIVRKNASGGSKSNEARPEDAQKRGEIGKEGILKVRPLPHREQSKKKCPLTVQGRRRSDDEKDREVHKIRGTEVLCSVQYSPADVGRSPHVFVLFLEQDAAPENTKIFGERELPYVSVKTELASGRVGGKLLFRQVKWTVMIKNGNQESNKESWTYTLEVNTGIVTVRDEPNFWGEKGDLWRATKSVTHVKDVRKLPSVRTIRRVRLTSGMQLLEGNQVSVLHGYLCIDLVWRKVDNYT